MDTIGKITTSVIVSQCMTGLCISAVIFICGYVGLNGGMELPFVLAMSVFAFDLAASMLALINITAFRVADASLDRYDRVKQTEVMDDSGKAVKLKNFDIDFKDVTFGYNESAVIKDMSFHIPQHSMTALVGKSGCGKSTVVNLIARFWDTDSGTVSIGGTDIKAMTTENLLENISVVFQNVYLFNDTVFNNVAFGKKGCY